MNTFLRCMLCLGIFAVILVRPGQTDVTANDTPAPAAPETSTQGAEPSAIQEGFTTDIDAAIAASTHTRPVMIVFSADWSPACQNLEGNVLPDALVQQAIRNSVVPARVNLSDRNNEAAYAIARRFDVQAIPTILLVNPQGQVLDAATGVFPAEQFARWIDPEIEIAPAAE